MAGSPMDVGRSPAWHSAGTALEGQDVGIRPPRSRSATGRADLTACPRSRLDGDEIASVGLFLLESHYEAVARNLGDTLESLQVWCVLA